MAVVAEFPDEMPVVFRTYCSQWPLGEQRHARPPILKPGLARAGGVVGRYQAALAASGTEAVVSTFETNGYFRGPFGPRFAHRGTAEPTTREDTPMQATYGSAADPAGQG